MKLLQILYPGLGGHSSVAFSLIEGDSEKQFTHHLIGYGIETPSASLLNKSKDLGTTFCSIRKRIGFDFISQIKIYQTLKKINPDYIIMHSTSLILVLTWYKLFNKIKFISVEHQSNHAKTNKDWLYTLLILVVSPKIVYLTKKYESEIKNKFNLFFNKKKITIISNGINTLKFKPNNNHEKNNPIIISMISRLNSLRDHWTLIDGFKEISHIYPVKLIIAGDGETKNRLEDYVGQQNLVEKVIFTGNINETEIIKLLSRTSIYVHSSLAETLSTSLLQVMACKIPIIATDISGINNLLVHNHDALLFKAKDTSDLIKSIKQLIENTKDAEKLAINAHKKIMANYSCVQMVKEYKQLITTF